MDRVLLTEAANFEERLFPLFEQAGVGFAKVGLDCRWLRVNQKLCEMTGYTEAELLSMNFCDITHPEDLEADLTNMQAVMAGKLPVNDMKKRYIHKDGTTIIWIHLNATLVRDEQGQPDYFITIIEDITKKKRFEQSLLETEERYRLVLQGSNDGIWDWDLKRNQTYWNERFYEIVGLQNQNPKPDPELGWTLIHPDDRELVNNSVKAHLEQGSKYELQFRFRRPSGEVRYVLARAQAVWNEQGEPIRMAGVVTDITETKLAQEELKTYALKLEKSNKELEQFATIASHDLQAPLRKVMIFSDTLKANAGDALPEACYDCIERIQKAATKMQHLITDLLILSRINRKGQPFYQTSVESAAQEAINALEINIAESKGRVELGPMVELEADPNQLQQLLQNLIENALKFHRPEEPPVVKVASQILKNGFCEITVSDNGIGFDERFLDRIFLVFERLHSDAQYRGTGIGLAICHKIVERHGGAITAKSKPGQGSHFIATLPVRQSTIG